MKSFLSFSFMSLVKPFANHTSMLMLCGFLVQMLFQFAYTDSLKIKLPVYNFNCDFIFT